MFCVICFEDCDFPFRRRDKAIYGTFADAEMEKERVQRDKNGNMNFQNSKHKSQNRDRNHQFRTQKTTKHNVTYRLP